MLYITKEDYDAIVAWAREHLPEEACGLLGGTTGDNGDKYVKKVYFIENTDHSNEHFTISPNQQLKAILDLRKNGLKMLGNWHSHPESPSRPSEEDKRLALDPSLLYLILSLMEEEPVLNAFVIDSEKNVSREEINVLSEF